MFQSLKVDRPTFQQRIRLPAYQMLYRNVFNRLCKHKEKLSYDFFSRFHEGGKQFIDLHRHRPSAYQCTTSSSFNHAGGVETTYLVVGSADRVVLLLEPEYAIARNLPFLSVFDGHFFRPCLESATAYWQEHMEPVKQMSENVLSSRLGTGVITRSFNFSN